MQFKFYIESGLFNKVIRKIHTSWSLSRKNHRVSQNKYVNRHDGYSRGTEYLLFSRPYWRDLRYLYINNLIISCIDSLGISF